MKNGDQPITPTIWRQISKNEKRIATAKEVNEGIYLSHTNGLTKREYFAGLAITSFFGKSLLSNDEIAKECVAMADALLIELAKEQNT